MSALVNPLKVIREYLQMSMDDLAECAGVNHNNVVRNEQGCYSNPSPKLLDFLLANSDYDRATLLEEYRAFQSFTRRSNFGVLSETFLRDVATQPDWLNPCRVWRENAGLSKARFGKLFCIHPAIVSRLENEPYLIGSLPGQYKEAMLDSGYPLWELLQLEKKYLLFKAYEVSKISSRNLSDLTSLGEVSV